MLRMMVELYFNNRLKEVFAVNQNAYEYLHNHERKHLAINEACDQILKAETHYIINDKLTPGHKKIVTTCADIFAAAALEHAEQRTLSAAEIARRVHDAGEAERLEQDKETIMREALDDKPRVTIPSAPPPKTRRGQ